MKYFIFYWGVCLGIPEDISVLLFSYYLSFKYSYEIHLMVNETLVWLLPFYAWQIFKLMMCIKHRLVHLISAFHICHDFSAVCPEDPLSAVEMNRASFSWKQSEEHDSDSVPDDKTEDGSPPRSFYLHALNLSVKRVCVLQQEQLAIHLCFSWSSTRSVVSPWLI